MTSISTIDTSHPPIVWGKKKKKDTYVLEFIPESERPLTNRSAGPSRLDRLKTSQPKLRGLQQHAPCGLVLGQWQTRPDTWRPFYERDVAQGMQTAWLPQVAAAMVKGPPSFKSRAWDPLAPFQMNAVRLLNLIAKVLEPPVHAVVPPPYAIGETTFGYPLMYNPIPGASSSTAPVRATASAGRHNMNIIVHTLSDELISSPGLFVGACMFISNSARKSLPLGLYNNKKGYLMIHLGYIPGGPPRSNVKLEYCHRLVLYLIFGPPPPSEQEDIDWQCCHICSNMTCLNPFHLVWGTKQDNYCNRMDRYIELARAQGHPEETIPLRTIQRVK